MRWLWFASFTLICSLLSVFFRQPLILIGEIILIDFFITRKVKWLFWLHQPIKIPFWLNLILWLSLTTWFIRIFAFDSIVISSPANRPTLQPGDNILVSKIHFGPRLPRFPLSPAHVRLSGISCIRQGDWIAYNFPEGDTAYAALPNSSYHSLRRISESAGDTMPQGQLVFVPVSRRDPEVSRCIGLPGDTLAIRAGSAVALPSKGSLSDSVEAPALEIENGLPLLFDYLTEVNNSQLHPELIGSLGISPGEVRILPGLGYIVPLAADQVEGVRIRPEVSGITRYIQDPGNGDYNIFPHDARFPWNRDNFGPVIVPGKGDTISLTLLNINIYRRIIETYEQNRLEVSNTTIYINGTPATQYTVKQDYYFVLGDNRHHSRDSRHWGFLPESHIIGKPVLIWFSAGRITGQPPRIYWNRILNHL
jgi:signal peptidase I